MTVRALFLLVVVEVLVRVTTVPKAGRILGVRLDLQPATHGRSSSSTTALPVRAERALRATRRVTANWPFCAGPCLRSALVGGRLLRRFDPAVRIGLAPADGLVRAHAWLEIDGVPLEDVEDYASFHIVPPVRERAS